MHTYKEACRQHILDCLDDWLGYEVDISEFGFRLTEYENTNGSWYCNRYLAEQDLKAWLVGGIPDYIKNDVQQPELLHCSMMIIGVERMFNELEVVRDHWSEVMTIDADFIKKVKEELQS